MKKSSKIFVIRFSFLKKIIIWINQPSIVICYENESDNELTFLVNFILQLFVIIRVDSSDANTAIIRGHLQTFIVSVPAILDFNDDCQE